VDEKESYFVGEIHS